MLITHSLSILLIHLLGIHQKYMLSSNLKNEVRRVFNGEDLEGYTGAGLYDSVPMDEEDQVVLDYSSDALMVDGDFRHSILSSIAVAGNAIEELYASPQDIEGVVKDGKIYIVHTRPQM